VRIKEISRRRHVTQQIFRNLVSLIVLLLRKILTDADQILASGFSSDEDKLFINVDGEIVVWGFLLSLLVEVSSGGDGSSGNCSDTQVAVLSLLFRFFGFLCLDLGKSNRLGDLFKDRLIDQFRDRFRD